MRCVQWAKVGIFVRKSQLADLSRHEEFGEAIFTLRDIYRVPVRRIARKMIKGGEVNICMGALPSPPLLLIQHCAGLVWASRCFAACRSLPGILLSSIDCSRAPPRPCTAP